MNDQSALLSRNIGKTAWYGYSPSLSDAQAIAMYTARYGQAPKEVIRGASVVLCGPVGDKRYGGRRYGARKGRVGGVGEWMDNPDSICQGDVR